METKFAVMFTIFDYTEEKVSYRYYRPDGYGYGYAEDSLFRAQFFVDQESAQKVLQSWHRYVQEVTTYSDGCKALPYEASFIFGSKPVGTRSGAITARVIRIDNADNALEMKVSVVCQLDVTVKEHGLDSKIDPVVEIISYVI